MAVAVGASWVGVEQAPKPAASPAVVIASPAPSATPAPAPSPAAPKGPVTVEVRLSCPEIALELRELRRTIQGCTNLTADEKGKLVLCGRCFFCTVRRIAVSR